MAALRLQVASNKTLAQAIERHPHDDQKRRQPSRSERPRVKLPVGIHAMFFGRLNSEGSQSVATQFECTKQLQKNGLETQDQLLGSHCIPRKHLRNSCEETNRKTRLQL